MAYLSEKRRTAKVTLPSDGEYWAVVKVGLKYGELKQYFEYGGSEKPFTIMEKLLLSIVEWNVTNEKDEVLPIDEASIDLLNEGDIVAIAEAATPKSDKEVKKNSSKQ